MFLKQKFFLKPTPAVYTITAISWEMQTEEAAFLFLLKPTCKEFHVLSNIPGSVN